MVSFSSFYCKMMSDGCKWVFYFLNLCYFSIERKQGRRGQRNIAGVCSLWPKKPHPTFNKSQVPVKYHILILFNTWVLCSMQKHFYLYKQGESPLKSACKLTVNKFKQ